MTNKIGITPDEMVELEKLCDRSSLYDVMCALAAICFEKAEHIEQSYSPITGERFESDAEAHRWRKRGLQVQGTAEYLERAEFRTVSYHKSMDREFTGRLKR